MLSQHPLDKIAKIYFDNLDVSPTTLRNYKYLLEKYIDYLKKNDIKYPSTNHILDYKKQLIKQAYKTNTLRNQILVIKGFYNWLKHSWPYYGFDKRYDYNIAYLVKNIPNSKNFSKEALTLKQARHLIDVAKQYIDNLEGLRNYCMITLMLTTGLRLIEMSRAKIENLKIYRDKYILYIRGKHRQDSTEFVKIPITVMKPLKRYLVFRQDKSPYLFVPHQKVCAKAHLAVDAMRNSITNLLIEAGYYNEKITPHSLRHTCAVINLEMGGSIEATQQLLRHVNIKTTQIYAHNIGRLKDPSVERISHHLFKGVKERYVQRYQKQ